MGDRMRSATRFGLLALLAGAFVFLASCGERGQRYPETGATLEGVVKYRNKPVPLALVIVVGKDTSANGKADEEGRFKVENVPLGEVEIGVNTDAAKGEMMSKSMAGAYKGPDGKGAGKLKMPELVEVPNKYFDPTGSGIKTTVKKGANTYDIELK